MKALSLFGTSTTPLRLILLTLGLFLLGSKEVYGQDPMSHIFAGAPSPNAASIMKIDALQPNVSDGSVAIDSPLHELKARNLAVDIRLSYRSGGVLVEEMPSWVGLGWSLQAGGMISRSVRGVPDENQFSNIYRNDHGYFSSSNKTSLDLAHQDNEACPVQTWFGMDGKGDSEPDVIRLQIGGRTLQIFYDHASSSFVTLPRTNMKITYQTSDTADAGIGSFGFAYDRYISSWTVVDEDGTRYIFDEVELTKTTVNGQERLPGHTYASGWYLTRIESAHGNDVIEFEYTPYTLLREHRARRQFYKSLGTGPSCDSAPSPFQPNGTLIRTTTTTWTHRVKSILSGNESVQLLATTDRLDSNWSPGSDSVQDKALDRIIVRSAEDEIVKRIDMTYDYLVSPTQPGISASSARRLILSQVSEWDILTNEEHSGYSFEYAGGLPHRYSYAIDHWGHYNGQTGNGYYNGSVAGGPPASPLPSMTVNWLDLYPQGQDWDVVNLSGANREPSSYHAGAGMLSKIVYPAGSSRSFQYEANTYSRIRNELLPQPKTGKGVRVASILEDDGMGNQKEYRYAYDFHAFHFETTPVAGQSEGLLVVPYQIWSRPFDLMGKSSGVIADETDYGFHNKAPLNGCDVYVVEDQSHFVLSISGGVTYDVVTVYEWGEDHYYDFHVATSPKTIYSSTTPNGQFDFMEITHLIEANQCEDPHNVYPRWNQGAVTSYASMYGLQDVVTQMNASNEIVHQKRYQYSPTNLDIPSSVVARIPAIQTRAVPGMPDGGIGKHYEIVVPLVREIRHVEYECSDGACALTREKITDYNFGDPSPHFVRRITERDRVHNEDRTRILRYASEQYPALASRNMVSPVFSEEVREGYSSGPVVSKTWTEYRTSGNGLGRPWRQWQWREGAAPSGATLPTSATSDLVTTYDAYDSYGRVTRQTDAAGLQTRFIYGGPGQSQLLQIEAGTSWTGANPDTVSVAYSYDSRGRLRTFRDQNGRFSRYSYDGLSRLTNIRGDANQLLRSYSYHYAGSSLSPSSPNYIRSRHYGAGDNAYVETTEFFDGLGRLVQTNERGETGTEIVTGLQYDGLGRVWRNWKPYERDRTGTAPSYATNLLDEAMFYYDSILGTSGWHRPYTETRYEASPLNRVRVILPEGVSSESRGIRYDYDLQAYRGGMYQRTLITNEEGKRSATLTDAFGRQVYALAGLGSGDSTTTGFAYDALDQLLSTTPPNYFRPRSGEQAAHSNYRTTYEYDLRGNLAETKAPDATQPTRYRYDRSGRLRFSRDARQQSSNQVAFTGYDAFSRPVVAGVASGVNLSAFNNLGADTEQSFETNQSNWHEVYHYDAPANPSAFPWNQATSWMQSNFTQANLKGNLAARAYRSGGVWQIEHYSYDTEGRISGKLVITQGLVEHDMRHTYIYDRQGRLTERRLMAGSFPWTFYHWYDYDALGRLESVYASPGGRPATPDAEYTYLATGQRASIRYRGMSSALPLTYTIRGRLRGIGNVASTTYPFSADYTYTRAGNILSSRFHTPSSPDAVKRWQYTYDYDELDRLTSARFSPWSGSAYQTSQKYSVDGIAYDGNGNVLSLKRRNEAAALVDNLGYSYSSSRNRLVSVNGKYFWHDANGNVTGWEIMSGGAGIASFGYDARNMMVSHMMQTPTHSPPATQYRYSADGQRYWKKSGSDSGTFYAMDGAVNVGVIGESWTDGGHWTILDPSGEVLGREEYDQWWFVQGRRYYLKDHLGSTRVVLDGNGSVVETRDHYPFGLEMPGRSFVSGQKTRENFTGHELDDESGLVYAGARYYMPGIGRWASVDPLADMYASHSPYNYVLNNPLILTDPTGECPIEYYDVNGIAVCKEVVVVADRFLDESARDIPFARTANAIPVAGLISQFDSPVPGPADLIAVGILGTALLVDAVIVARHLLTNADNESHEDTPASSPGAFENVRRSKALRNKETGEIWEKDLLHRDHWEVYKNKKNWEKGKRDRSVWDDGRLKQTF